MQVRWYRRLSFRLAVLLVLAILVSEAVAPTVYGVIYDFFDLPPYHEDLYIFDELPEEDTDELLLDADGFEIPDGAFLITAEAARTEARLSLALAIALPILTALLFAWIISRAVTGRVSRLARQAAAPVQASGNLPGPFDARGHDEIAQLAGAMNSMRDRVHGLLEVQTEKDAAHREWVAQVSHDLRTPLTALIACMGRAEVILSKNDDPALRAELGDVLSIARSDIDRVHTLAEDLFEVARMESTPTLEREPIPPGELLRQAVRSLQPIADAQQIDLSFEVAKQLPPFAGDGRLLLRATENLLRNALQHATSKIVASATATEGDLRLEVRDDGPGFPDAASGASPERRSDSAGLGLLVARRVVELHEGSLDIRNLPEGGAGVALVLPLVGDG